MTSILFGSFVFRAALLWGHGQAAPPPPGLAMLETGVSAILAGQRSAILADIRYDLQFHIPAQRDAPIPAEETLSFTLGGNNTPSSGTPLAPLILDFKEKTSPRQLQVNGTEVPVTHQQEHLLIPAEFLHPGPNTIHILFTAGNGALNRNKDFLYTFFVPERSLSRFPCFDPHDLKSVL